VLGECEGLVFSRPLDAESGYEELHVAAAAAAASGTDTY